MSATRSEIEATQRKIEARQEHFLENLVAEIEKREIGARQKTKTIKLRLDCDTSIIWEILETRLMAWETATFEKYIGMEDLSSITGTYDARILHDTRLAIFALAEEKVDIMDSNWTDSLADDAREYVADKLKEEDE